MAKDMENHLESKQKHHIDQLLLAFLTEKKRNEVMENENLKKIQKLEQENQKLRSQMEQENQKLRSENENLKRIEKLEQQPPTRLRHVSTEEIEKYIRDLPLPSQATPLKNF